MKTALIRTLIQKGVIRERTSVEAYHLVHGLSCTNNSRVMTEFYILKAKKRGDNLFFDVFNHEHAKTEISAEDILTVDGMDETRVAEAYSLSETGKIIPEGKRRGRKPKGWVDEPQQIADIERLSEFGWSVSDIAQKLNIEEDKVKYVLQIDIDLDDWADDEEDEFEDDLACAG